MQGEDGRYSEISIHALREERDLVLIRRGRAAQRISIHALREERDVLGVALLDALQGFQSTRSARSATAKKHKTEERSL